jgi:hypothetical protein
MMESALVKIIWFSGSNGRAKRPYVVALCRKGLVWELKVSGQLFGYPGQDPLFFIDVFPCSMYGGRYPAEFNLFFSYHSYRLLKDLLKLRLKLAKVTGEAVAAKLLHTQLKPVYWSYNNWNCSNYDTDCSITDYSKKPVKVYKNAADFRGEINLKNVSLPKGLAKEHVRKIRWSFYRMFFERFFFKKTLFLELLKKAYQPRLWDEDDPLLLRSPLHFLGIYLTPFSCMENAPSYSSLLWDRHQESGAIFDRYPDANELRKGADWFLMAGLERKNNGARQWTFEEEVLFEGFVEVYLLKQLVDLDQLS